MTIKTYWALSAEESAKHEHAVTAQNDAQTKARDYVLSKIDCDGVFITTHGSIYLGFKKLQDNKMLHKKPKHFHDGCHLYTTKSKTEWNNILIDAEKIIKGQVKFQDYCKNIWPEVVREVIGEGSSPTSYSLSKTAFGFLKGQLVICLPLSDDEKLDKNIIPDGFYELTMSQYQELVG